MSIIIVDDNMTNQMIIKTILSKAGYYDIRIASSAQQLFDMLHLDNDCQAEETVDLILLDMMMPGIDGLEACKRVQADTRYKDVPIIFVTAVGDSNKLAEALDAGASDYVMKPINKLELLARIRSALKLKYEKDWHKERDKRIRYELELAKQVQRSVLSESISDENIEIEAVYRPSSELAGDYYAWFRIDQHRYGIVLLDMMGHGIASSLVCMFISSVLRNMTMLVSDPEEVIQRLNRYMGQLYQKDELINYYFTAIYVLVDTHKKTFEYVNAGHPPGIFAMEDETALLESSAPAIGLFSKIKVEKYTKSYQSGDIIMLYTDGLLDVMSETEEEESYHFFANQLKEKRGESLESWVDDFIQEEKHNVQRDDICLVRIGLK